MCIRDRRRALREATRAGQPVVITIARDFGAEGHEIGKMLSCEPVSYTHLDVYKRQEYVRDIRPGEILRINDEGLVSEQGVPAAEKSANCIFEQVYFARPDSIMNGKSVYACRYDMGRMLAIESPVNADMVIGVPDSGMPPAEGFAHESGIRYGEGLIKNRYVARTFICLVYTSRCV